MGCRRRSGDRPRNWLGLCCSCGFLFFKCSLRFRIFLSAEMPSYFFGLIVFQRTRMRLLFSDTDFRQILDEHFGLDFKLARQLVDSDLSWV